LAFVIKTLDQFTDFHETWYELVEISGCLNLCISPVTNNTIIMAELAPKGPEIFYENILE
jgi:hypothetical protein